MKIIVEGHEIETQDIWDIELELNSYEAYVLIKVKDKAPIKIGRKIPYETYRHQYQEYYAPYKKLYADVKDKWESDKSTTPVFKL